MRKWMRLFESDEDEAEWREALEDGNWNDALLYSETPEQVAEVIEACGAKEIVFRSQPSLPPVYVIENFVIEWDGKSRYANIESKDDWVSDADLDLYYPGHEEKFNNDFWQHPHELYHATVPDKADSIEQTGIHPKNETRGLNNRSVGQAVFTTSDFEETAMGSYGSEIFEIDTVKMAADGYRPYVSLEPPVVEWELRRSLANLIDYDEYEPEYSSDMSESTVIVYGAIPPQYLTRLET